MTSVSIIGAENNKMITSDSNGPSEDGRLVPSFESKKADNDSKESSSSSRPSSKTDADVDNDMSQKTGKAASNVYTYKDYSRVSASSMMESDSAATGSQQQPQQQQANREPTFPSKLHQILSDPRFQDIIAWLPHGRSWRILQQKAFEEVVIPLYFNHGRYASFTRQINGWGFRRVTTGTDYNSYYHELFLRGIPHLCLRMKREKAPSLCVSKRSRKANSKGKTGSGSTNKKNQIEDTPVPDFYAISRENPLPEVLPPRMRNNGMNNPTSKGGIAGASSTLGSAVSANKSGPSVSSPSLSGAPAPTSTGALHSAFLQQAKALEASRLMQQGGGLHLAAAGALPTSLAAAELAALHQQQQQQQHAPSLSLLLAREHQQQQLRQQALLEANLSLYGANVTAAPGVALSPAPNGSGQPTGGLWDRISQKQNGKELLPSEREQLLLQRGFPSSSPLLFQRASALAALEEQELQQQRRRITLDRLVAASNGGLPYYGSGPMGTSSFNL